MQTVADESAKGIEGEELKKKKTVTFSASHKQVLIPCRHEFRELYSDIWWSRTELHSASAEAAIILRETMSDNPCLSIQSAMCLLYQSEEMFGSRVRMLIVNNDNAVARLSRNKITEAHRSNIWEVEICTIKAAFKIIAGENANYFDLILVQTSPCIKDYFLLRQLVLGLHRLREERTLVGIHFDDSVDDDIAAKVTANVHFDLTWRGSFSVRSHSDEQVNLRKLLAVRHLEESDHLFWSKGELKNSLDGSVVFSVFSFPLGYTFTQGPTTL